MTLRSRLPVLESLELASCLYPCVLYALRRGEQPRAYIA